MHHLLVDEVSDELALDVGAIVERAQALQTPQKLFVGPGAEFRVQLDLLLNALNELSKYGVQVLEHFLDVRFASMSQEYAICQAKYRRYIVDEGSAVVRSTHENNEHLSDLV